MITQFKIFIIQQRPINGSYLVQRLLTILENRFDKRLILQIVQDIETSII
jgi:hypothetical protein